ncbi:MAG TPA: GGDEF domain-containing protein [Ruminococcus sp.]|nr:GGDEF domain-containing protein [Ruminococcus sp.]
MSDNCDIISERMYSIGRVVVDKSLHTQSADEPFFRFFGNDVIYSIRRTIEEEDQPKLDEAIEASADGTVRRTVLRMKGVAGEQRWIMASVKKLSADRAEEPLYSVSFSDIFSLEELAYNRQRKISDYRYVLSLISDLAFEYSFETKRIRIFMFDCCREMVLADEELEKWRKDSIDSGYILSRYIETFNSLCRDIKSGVYRFDYELESSILTSGETRELCLFRGLTRYDDPDNRRVTGMISVVSSRQKSKEANLTLEANRDSLSGLLNKRAVTSFATELIEAKPPHNVNLVILDIDDFTEINSGYGHLFGDEVIYTVAGIIKTEIGTRGIAGRISGSGFLIVLEDTRDEEDLRGVLRAIRTNTEHAFADRSENFRLTCSMGVSTYPVDSKDYDELFMQADKALYIAQQKGKNRYVIYDIDKHGPVEKDIGNKIVFLGSRDNATEKLSFMGQLSESLVLGKVPDISVLLEQIRTQFAIDDICIFAGNEMNLILSCGNAQSRNAPYLFENHYTERFSGDGVFVIDNVNELEGRDDNALAVLTEQNIGGALQYLMTEDSIIKGMISFCYTGRFKKWAVSDINYLTIIGRTVTALLKKNAYI